MISPKKGVPSPFFQKVYVGYFVLAGAVLSLVWILLEFASLGSLLSYPQKLPNSPLVQSLQQVNVFSVVVAAVAMVVNIGVLVHLFVPFYRAEERLDFEAFYSFVSSPAELTMFTTTPLSPAERTRAWRYSVLFEGTECHRRIYCSGCGNLQVDRFAHCF